MGNSSPKAPVGTSALNLDGFRPSAFLSLLDINNPQNLYAVVTILVLICTVIFFLGNDQHKDSTDDLSRMSEGLLKVREEDLKEAVVKAVEQYNLDFLISRLRGAEIKVVLEDESVSLFLTDDDDLTYTSGESDQPPKAHSSHAMASIKETKIVSDKLGNQAIKVEFEGGAICFKCSTSTETETIAEGFASLAPALAANPALLKKLPESPVSSIFSSTICPKFCSPPLTITLRPFFVSLRLSRTCSYSGADSSETWVRPPWAS